MDKRTLRDAMRAQRQALGAASLAEAEARASAALLSHPAWTRARTVALHVAVRGELPTRVLLAAALAAGKRVALPRQTKEGMELRVLKDSTAMVPGPHGINEPSEEAPKVNLAEVDLVLTPGLAFDRQGNRLGQGGGDYDRLLGRLGAATAVIGWCHGFQLVETVPVEVHDRKVGWICTPTGLFPTG